MVVTVVTINGLQRKSTGAGHEQTTSRTVTGLLLAPPVRALTQRSERCRDFLKEAGR